MAIGDRLKSSMSLLGAPGCIETAKCMMMAGEKGIDCSTALFDPSSPEVSNLSPLGVGPILQHVDYAIVGVHGIISYLDDKGFGQSLVIRNGVVRANQWQWIQYAIEVLQPNMEDDEKLEKCFSELDKRLSDRSSSFNGDFICGVFSTADVHWAGCANKLVAEGRGSLIEKHSSVSQWWNNIKSHPSTSKEKLLPFTCMPTKEDMANNSLRDILINKG